jgi:hypothetical protein
MPFSSQPRKKGTQAPQEGQRPSCGAPASKKEPTTPTDNAASKRQIISIREKLADKFLTDPKAAEKAAFIISLWINENKSKTEK